MRAEQELIRLGVLYGVVLLWAFGCAMSAVPRRPLSLGTLGARRYRLLHNGLVGVGGIFCLTLAFTGQAHLFAFLAATAILLLGLYAMQEGSFVGKVSLLLQDQYDAWSVTEATQTTITLPSEVGVCLPPSIENSLTNLLQHAINNDAESIYLQPSSQNTARVYFHVDGERKRFATIESEAVAQFVDVLEGWKLKGVASMNRAGNGWLRFPLDGGGRLFAYQSQATSHGTKLTIHSCARADRLVRGGLSSLGLNGERLNQVRQFLTRPSGMLLVCGPRRNGKSTTGMTMVAELASVGRQVCVVQHAPGLILDNAKTFIASTKPHDTVPEWISELRRQGPGVLLVDDVDEKAELVAAVEAAALDQLVVVTVPGTEAETVFKSVVTQVSDRLVLETSLMGIVEQRLLPRLCAECRRQAPFSYADRVALGIEGSGGSPPVGYVPVGCHVCQGTGYQGRVGVFSVIECGPVWAKWRTRASRPSVLKELRDHKLRQVRSDVAKKVLEGVCAAADAREVLEADALI